MEPEKFKECLADTETLKAQVRRFKESALANNVEIAPMFLLAEKGGEPLMAVFDPKSGRDRVLAAARLVASVTGADGFLLVADAYCKRMPAGTDPDSYSGGSMQEAVKRGERGDIVDAMTISRVRSDSPPRAASLRYEYEDDGRTVRWLEDVDGGDFEGAAAGGVIVDRLTSALTSDGVKGVKGVRAVVDELRAKGTGEDEAVNIGMYAAGCLAAAELERRDFIVVDMRDKPEGLVGVLPLPGGADSARLPVMDRPDPGPPGAIRVRFSPHETGFVFPTADEDHFRVTSIPLTTGDVAGGDVVTLTPQAESSLRRVDQIVSHEYDRKTAFEYRTAEDYERFESAVLDAGGRCESVIAPGDVEDGSPGLAACCYDAVCFDPRSAVEGWGGEDDEAGIVLSVTAHYDEKGTIKTEEM